MVLEGDLPGRTSILLLKPAKVEGIVLVAGADVIDKEVVVGDEVALVGVVPEPANILNQLTLVIDQDIVDGNDALVAEAGVGVLLQEFESPLVDLFHVPSGLGEEAVEAGLIAWG